MNREFLPRNGIGELPELPPEEEVDHLEAYALGFKRQSWVTGMLMEEDRQFEADPEYFPEDDTENATYPASEMVGAKSAEHAAYIRSQIDTEREELEVIESSWAGVLGEVAGAVISPETFVGGGLAAVPKIGYKALAVGETALIAGSEMALHEQQRLRTVEESLINVGATYGGSLILGKAGKWINDVQDKAVVRKDAAEMLELLTRPATDDAGVPIKTPSEGMDAGSAATAPGDPEDWGMSGGWLAKKLAVGPLKNIMQSESDAARKIGLRLVESPFFTKGGQKGVTAGVPVEAYVNTSIGRAVDVIENAQKLQKASGLNKTDFDDAVGIAMSNGDTHAIDQVAQAAKAYREGVFDPIKADAQKYGLLPKTKAQLGEEIIKDAGPEAAAKLAKYRADVDAGIENPKLEIEGIEPFQLEDWKKAPDELGGYSDSYFTRIYRPDKIHENYSSLKTLIRESYLANGVESTAVAEQAARDVVDNMLGGLPLVTPGAHTSGMALPDSTRARVVKLLDNQLLPYKENRASAVALQHAMGISPHIEMKRVFGDFDFDEEIRKIQLEYQRKMDGATPKEVKRLNKEARNTLGDIELLRNRVMNRIMHADEFGGMQRPMAKAVKVMQAWNVSAQLGGIVFSSAPDVVRPLSQYGLRSYAAGLASYGKYLFRRSKEDGVLTKSAVRRTGLATERARNQRAMDMMDMQEGSEKVSDWVGRKWGKFTGFNAYTDMMEHITAQSAANWTLRLAKKAAAGKKLTRAETGAVSRMGMHLGDLREIAAEVDRMGNPGGDLLAANTLGWNNKALAMKFEAGLGSDVRRTIIRIGAADKPHFMDKLTWRLLLQYQSFAMAASNRMLVAGLQQRDMKLAMGLMAGLYMGAQVRAGKAWLRGEDPEEWSDERWLAEGIDGSGWIGVYGFGLRSLMVAMGETPARYANREIEGMFGGPTTSTIGSVYRGGSAAAKAVFADDEETAEKEGEKAKKYLSRATPFWANTWHFRQLMEKSMGEEE